MDFHYGQVPIAALFCVRPAQTGGLSKISSSVRIYNELLAHRPDLVEVLSKPLVWTKYGEGEPGEVDHYESPAFDFLNGYLCTALGPKHIKKGYALPNVPDLTAPQAEAVRVAEELAAEFHFATRLEAGDVLLTNNFVALHTRDGFVDWPEPERRRLMWRLWLVNDELRPPTAYARQWRHGIRLSTTQDRLVLS